MQSGSPESRPTTECGVPTASSEERGRIRAVRAPTAPSPRKNCRRCYGVRRSENGPFTPVRMMVVGRSVYGGAYTLTVLPLEFATKRSPAAGADGRGRAGVGWRVLGDGGAGEVCHEKGLDPVRSR